MKLEIIAHRGFSAIAPENTKAAFTEAIRHGADSIEFDVQLCSDGIPVVFHDLNLDRTTTVRGKLRNKNLEYLKQLDAGIWWGEKFAGEKILTLIEALKILKEVPQFLYFDVKLYDEWSDVEVKNFVDILINSGVQEKAVITSFNDRFLDRVRQLSDNLTFSRLVSTESNYETQLAKAVEMGDRLISSEYQMLLDNRALIENARSQGVDIVAWTVDNRHHLQHLVEMGVTRIITNSLIGGGE